MPKPPPPRPKGDLDEVERAISVLGGRHPEHERTRRETLAAAEKRRVVLEAELAQSSRRRRRRALVLTANVVAVGVAAFVTWRLVGRASRIREALARDEAPFVAQGMEEVASNQLTARTTMETEAPAASCFVAISTTAHLRVTSSGRVLEAGRSLGWCACEAEHVSIATDATAETSGLALLRIDARAIGGPLARAWTALHPESWSDAGAACADATLDSWIDDHKWPRPAIDPGALDAVHGHEPLQRAGFRLVSRVAEATPFAVVEAEAEQCLLATAGEGELSLRLHGGARPIDHALGAMLWCASQAATVTVWRSGTSAAPALILSAPARRVAGLLGATECAHDAGLPVAPAATWLKAEDLAWDAATLLRASALDGVVSGPLAPAPGSRDARIAALVFSPPTRAAWDPPAEGSWCEPALEAPAALTESVCIFASPVALWRSTEGSGAFARANVPVWLSSIAARSEPDALARIPELLALARQLSRQGFEPTVLEGVTELPEGVRVVGRAGEDAVVAMGLAPKRPWVFPYTDGIPWDLGDEARVISLQPGTAVKLKTSPLPDVPLDKRRTVVFRRALRP